MKKIFIATLAFFSLALVSCQNGPDLSGLRTDDVDQSIKDQLLINFDDTTGKRLEPDDRTNQASYYDVYVNTDTKTNLLTYNIALNQLSDGELSFKEAVDAQRFRGASISTLVFNSNLYADELTTIMGEVYNGNYGISKATDKVSDLLGIEVKTKNTWTQQINCDLAVKAYKDGKTNVELQIVYLPIFVKRVYNRNVNLKIWGLVPVSYTFVVDGKLVTEKDGVLNYSEANPFESFKNVVFRFNPEPGKTSLLNPKAAA